jgi:outer membrane protein TolC
VLAKSGGSVEYTKDKSILVMIWLLGAVFMGTKANAQSNSLSLETALDLLRQTNDWQISELNFKNAELSLMQAQAATGLQASGNSSYALTAPGSGSNTQSLSVAANASITVLPWASAFDGVRRAERGLLRAQFERRDAQNNLIISLKGQYFAARLALQDLALAENSEKISQQQWRNAINQKANGQISQESLLLAERNAANASANRQQAERAVALARLTIASGINQASQGNWNLDTAPQVLAIPAGNLTLLSEKAFGQRSDVQKALLALQDANENLASSQRDRWLPNASINSSYGSRDSLSLSAGLNLQNGALSVGASYPLLTGNSSAATPASFSLTASLSLPFVAPASDGKIDSAQVSLKLATIALQNAKQSALLDIQGRLNDTANTAARLDIARLVVASSEQAIATSRARQIAGLTTALEVMQAELTLQQSQRDLEAAVVNQVNAAYKLQQALGETIQ